MVTPTGEADITIFTVPLCGKCAAVKKTLGEIQRERPSLAVEELSLLANLGLARRSGVVATPGLLVHGKPLRGVVSKAEILKALDSDP